MAILLRRTCSRYYLQCSRLKLFLSIVFLFGLFYILLISNSIQQKNLDYATKITIKAPIELPNSTAYLPEETQFTLRLLDFEGFSSNVTDETVVKPDLPECQPLGLITDYKTKISQATLLIEDLEEFEVERNHPSVLPGGVWKPNDCKARHKVAVIIPYRDRKSHLTRLLDFLIPIMQKQRLDFRFIVTEQYGDDLFNKGRIMNAAFQLAMKLKVDCVIFHDVDMFPQDDRTPYDCPDTPRHLGAFVSNLGYQLWYKEIVGGALAIRMEDYLAVNGYSNLYWAWGGEDDDMGKRILSQNYTIERPNQEYARFSMLKHVKRKRTAPKLIYKLLDDADSRWHSDGVNETDHWKIKSLIKRPLYYHLFVDVGPAPAFWRST